MLKTSKIKKTLSRSQSINRIQQPVIENNNLNNLNTTLLITKKKWNCKKNLDFRFYSLIKFRILCISFEYFRILITLLKQNIVLQNRRI